MKYTTCFFKYLLFSIAVVLSMETVVQAATSIAVVEIQRIFENAKPAIKATRKLEVKFKPRQDILRGKQAELELLVRSFDKNQVTWSKSQVQKEQQKIIKSRRELQRHNDELQKDFQHERAEAMGKVEKIIEAAIAKIAKRKKIDLVIFQGVAYHKPSLNITKIVIDQLNKK